LNLPCKTFRKQCYYTLCWRERGTKLCLDQSIRKNK